MDPIKEEMMLHIQEEREERLNLQINASNAKELDIGKFNLSFLYFVHLNIELVMRDMGKGMVEHLRMGFDFERNF